MIRCPTCNQHKVATEFAFQYSTLGIRQVQCRACVSAYFRRYYKRHKERLDAARRRNVKNARANARLYVREYLLCHPCVDCREDDPLVLEFDHVRGKKIDAIAQLIQTGVSLRVLQREIDKCDVRCANCHRRKTATTAGWYKVRLNHIDERTEGSGDLRLAPYRSDG